MIDFRLLGAVEVRGSRADGAPADLSQPKRLALLMYLALAEPVGLHSRDRLLATFWPDADDASARHSLRNALHALRQALGDEAIVTRGESWVGLERTAIRCDVLELRAHLAAGRVDDAIALWAGDLAPGFHLAGAPDFDRWLEEQRRGIERALRAAAWNRARELEGAGAAELAAVERAARLDPGSEPGVRRLMQLLAEAGDRGGALQAYDEFAEWLAHEIDVEPAAETRALAERLRAGAMPPRAIPARAAPEVHAAESSREVPSRDPDPSHSGDRSQTVPATRSRRGQQRRAVALALFGATALGAWTYVSRLREPLGDPASEAQLAVLRMPARYLVDTSAYSSYLRGLTLRFQFRFMASRDTLAALVDRRPLYVPGLCELAHAWIFTTLNNLTDAEESWPRIDALAQRALALDSTAASAWLVLASEDMFVRRNLPRAGERISRALQLDPRNPDVAGIRSIWFRFHGQMDSAVAEARLAHQLDPLSIFYERLLGKQLFFARQYEPSRRVYMRMLQETPGWMRGYEDLSELSIAMGQPREAVKWLRLARATAGDSAGAAALSVAQTDDEAIRLLESDARRLITRLDSAALAGNPSTAGDHASAFASLRDTVATLRWLDSMLVQHDSYVHQVRVDPAFDFLRAEPRYRDWESRTGLPPLGPEWQGRLRETR